MRKCPNCKKAVPVGARRCVYCRTLVDEASKANYETPQFDSTSMGVALRSNATWDEDSGNSTSFGKPGSNTFKSAMNEDFSQGSPKTMLGLGVIGSDNARIRAHEEEEVQGFAQTTIAGMPGITFDKSPNIGTGNLNIASDNLEKRLQASTENRDSFITPMPTKANTEEEKNDAADDPLFGLLGVIAPKPSSLIDEEFTNLSHEVFGDDFNFKLDDEEDGWDFDFLPQTKTAPDEKKPEKANQYALDKNETATASVSVSPDILQSLKTALSEESQEEEKKSEALAKTQAISPITETKAKETGKIEKISTPETATQSKKTAEKSAAKSGAELRELPKKKEKSTSIIELLLVIITAIACVSWIAIPSQEHGLVWDNLVNVPKNLALIAISGLSSVACLAALKPNNSQTLRLVVFIFVALAMVAGIVISPIGQWNPHRSILGAAAVLAVICALIQLFKKPQ